MILLGTRSGKKVEYIMVHDMYLEDVWQFRDGQFAKLSGTDFSKIMRLGHIDYLDFDGAMRNISINSQNKPDSCYVDWETCLASLVQEKDTLVFWDFDHEEIRVIHPDLYQEIAIKDYITQDEHYKAVRNAYTSEPVKIKTKEELQDWLEYLKIENEEVLANIIITSYEGAGETLYFLSLDNSGNYLKDLKLPFVVITRASLDDCYDMQVDTLHIEVLTNEFWSQ